MGIQGLLSFLEKASKPVNISEFSGCTVAVDTYCWLHKGAFPCAEKLARGEHTDQYVNYCMKYVNMLLSFNIKPILVFDGRHLPAKSETEKKRRELREKNRKRAAELLRLERVSEARSLIQRSVDVTHEMASNLMKQCRAQGVDCIVAPFEADAQLAYLNIQGFAHIVITEDSDLMLFGCNLVLFKMDLYGNGVLIEQQKIPLAMKQHPNQFSMDKFRYMCILSGCDYLKSLPGIGLAKACKFFKKTADDNIKRALTRLGGYLNMPNLVVTEEYRDKFVEADFMFKYQPVFDPVSRKVVTLNPLPPNVNNPLKDVLDRDTSYQLALGNLNPFTLEKIDSWNPDEPQTIKTNGWKTTVQRHKSIWSKDYHIPAPLPPKKDPREVVRTVTKGKTVVQPVTTLTDKIAGLSPKPNIEEELSKLRETYGIKTPLTTKVYEVEKSESPSINIEEDDVFQNILKTPEKKKINVSTECTIDDILCEDGSPILDGKVWRNPFSTSAKQKKECQSKISGGALDRFSRLKRTIVEEASIVQSRYFGGPTTEAKAEVRKNFVGEAVNFDSATFVDDMLAGSSPRNSGTSENSKIIKKHLSPEKNLFSITDINDMSKEATKKTVLHSPGKNIFSVTSAAKRDSLNRTEIESPSKKNIFSVANVSGHTIEATSPKPQSFLNILDSISKNKQDNEHKTVKPTKKLSSPSFRWRQPLLDFSLHKSLSRPESEAKKINEDFNKPRTSQSQFLKSPQNKFISMKGKSPASKKRSGSLLEKNKLKKSSSETGIVQPFIFDKFAFQPKPKLKMQ